MRKSIGEGKSGAARLILEAAVELDLRDEEVACISLQLRALLRMRAVYDPADTEEEQLQRSMRGKQSLVDRAPPDPLQWWSRYHHLFCNMGLTYQAVIDDKINEYNKGHKDNVQINKEVKAFLKLAPYLLKDFTDLLQYQYHNYKVHEGPIPNKVWLLEDLNPALRTVRCSADNKLWLKSSHGLLRQPIIGLSVKWALLPDR